MSARRLVHIVQKEYPKITYVIQAEICVPADEIETVMDVLNKAREYGRADIVKVWMGEKELKDENTQ
jgi:hypothetical protein